MSGASENSMIEAIFSYGLFHNTNLIYFFISLCCTLCSTKYLICELSFNELYNRKKAKNRIETF